MPALKVTLLINRIMKMGKIVYAMVILNLPTQNRREGYGKCANLAL
jgi:hypothetical protein